MSTSLLPPSPKNFELPCEGKTKTLEFRRSKLTYNVPFKFLLSVCDTYLSNKISIETNQLPSRSYFIFDSSLIRNNPIKMILGRSHVVGTRATYLVFPVEAALSVQWLSNTTYPSAGAFCAYQHALFLPSTIHRLRIGYGHLCSPWNRLMLNTVPAVRLSSLSFFSFLFSEYERSERFRDRPVTDDIFFRATENRIGNTFSA